MNNPDLKPCEDKVIVTDIQCSCGMIHSFAGKKDHYLGSKPAAIFCPSSPERKRALEEMPNPWYADSDEAMSEFRERSLDWLAEHYETIRQALQQEK